MTLAELKNNEEAIIVKIKGRGIFRKRLLEMGFVAGKKIKAVRHAPLKDPVEYNIMGYEVSLRKSEAAMVELVSESEVDKFLKENQHNTWGNNILKKGAEIKSKRINVALVGNPNCGKTTLFNKITGLQEHVGNYGGVTVDSKKGNMKQDGYSFQVTDLPGTYSLTAYSPEELYVRSHIIDDMPDVVINVVDGSNLERNLYLTARLIDMDIKVVMALNMHDQMLKNGDEFDYKSFGEMLGIPVIPTVAAKGGGLNELFKRVIQVYNDEESILRHVHIDYGKGIERGIQELQNTLDTEDNLKLTNQIAARFIALNLLDGDEVFSELVGKFKNGEQVLNQRDKTVQRLEQRMNDDTETLISDARYGFVRGALHETYKSGVQERHPRTQRIDRIISHRIYGLPLFLGFMYLMFQATFTLGEYPMNWIEQGVGMLGNFTAEHMSSGMLKDLIIDGVINGVGGVIVFLPNILILFFLISLMEDTGYMARAAFITDRVMQKIGLHGKAFIPMIMGFGCNVPAIMATRTLPHRQDRILTMLINPFMSCSARLPVYLIIVGAVFPERAGIVLFLIYFTGIVLSILVALLFKAVLFKKNNAPFVLELPPYRMPVFTTTLRHMWSKASQYLKKMGGIILVASVIIWSLSYFPQQEEMAADIDDRVAKMEDLRSGENIELNRQLDEKIDSIQQEFNMYQQKNSYIGKVGQFSEPVLRPLGFDWRMGVSILSGVAAKEIVVSTMGVLYGVSDAEGNSSTLIEQIRNVRYDSGKKKGQLIFTGLTAVSFLIFILVYFPCIATIVAIKNESNVKWAVFTMVYTTGLAWVLAFLIQTVGQLFI
ncbi:MAG: ferrous iron transport protein B [Bacteroidota bacterium]|nr:ferrous iron transport protein B [Bacteroidota bacterium]